MTDRSKSIARVQFLGTQRITIGAEVITPESERLFAMIVRLSVPLGRLTSRQTMLDLLWPGAEDAPARHNLRQTVYKARELGLVVESDEDGLRLDPRHWSCDWEDAIGDVPGEWLSEYEPEFSDELRSWIGSQRIGVHASLRPRLIRTLQSARSSGDLLLADRHAVQLLRVDELNEEATLTRAEVMALQGAKVDALKLLDAYLHEIGRLGSGKDAALPAQLLRRRIAEKLPALTYNNGSQHYGPLIGRADEAKRLLAGLFDARAGRGTATLVHGAEGIGKSRVLLEAKRAAVLQGMRILELTCESAPAPAPLSVLRELVRRLLEVRGAFGIAPDALASIRVWLISNEAAPDDCPLMEIEDLLASVSEETPLLLLIEHAERMDGESLGRLDRVYRRGVSRYHQLILTSSTYATPSDAAVTLCEIERLGLRPMSLVDVRDVVTAFAAEALPRATRDQITCAAVFAEGNPMYGVEMLGLILDPGSPDVIPWRVKVAVEKVVASLGELELRVLTLCSALQACANQSIIADALKVKDDEFMRVLDKLEMAGLVACNDGRLHASPQICKRAARCLSPALMRADALAAGNASYIAWKTALVPDVLYASLRLFVAAKAEDQVALVLDESAGTLLRQDTATQIVFELSQLRKTVRQVTIASTIDAIVARVLAGSQSKRSGFALQSESQPASFPAIQDSAVDIQYSYALQEHLEQAQSVCTDPDESVSRRLSEAIMALITASNLGNRAALDAAFRIVNTLSFSTANDAFALNQARVIYFSCIDDGESALQSASELAQASRQVKDVELACKGFRNAASATSYFGSSTDSRALLYEARSLAARLQYPAQVVKSDLRLADLAIDELDVDGARSHLSVAAEMISTHELQAVVDRADLLFHTCWEAIISRDRARASKAARDLRRLLRSQRTGLAHLTVVSVRLATHRGGVTRESLKDFALLNDSLSNTLFALTSQRFIAAQMLFARACGSDAISPTFAEGHIARLVERGHHVWPYLNRLASGHELVE